jgi:preprotein translocase subunit SecG
MSMVWACAWHVHGVGMAWAWHGHGGHGHGMGMAWAWHDFSGQVSSTIALVRALFGDFSFEEISDNSRGYLNTILFLTYLFTAVFILLSMFLSILGESQAVARTKENEEKERGEHVDYGTFQACAWRVHGVCMACAWRVLHGCLLHLPGYLRLAAEEVHDADEAAQGL